MRIAEVVHATRPPAHLLRRESFGAQVRRLRTTAEAGSPQAWFELASLLEDGLRDRRGRQRVAPDVGAAFRAYRHAALGGCQGAWGNLGVCYDSGTGVRRNITRARECYHREWKLHHSGAYNLGTWYRDRGRYREAYRWYERAMEGADGDALVTMGYCRYFWIGVTASRRPPGPRPSPRRDCRSGPVAAGQPRRGLSSGRRGARAGQRGWQGRALPLPPASASRHPRTGTL